MRIQELLRYGRNVLTAEGMEEEALEAEILLRHALQMDRTLFYSSLEEEAQAPKANLFSALLERRLSRVPLSYLTTQKEFYGLTFAVDPRVLIPRPETEVLVDKVLEVLKTRLGESIPIVVDVGTGSGAISVALARQLPDITIYATDISADALQVAYANCMAHGVEDHVSLLQGDLLDPLTQPVDLIVANLPYVQSGEISELEPELRFEPSIALDGGREGLDVIARLLLQVPRALKPKGAVLLEIDHRQVEAVNRLALSALPGARVSVTQDLAGLGRVVQVQI